MSFLDTIQRILSERGELESSSNVTDGMALPISSDALSGMVSDFNESQLEKYSGTNVLDSWHNPIRLALSFGGFSTNRSGEVLSCVVATAYSFGRNGKDDGGVGDDILMRRKIFIARKRSLGTSFGRPEPADQAHHDTNSELIRLRLEH